jgi:hypothetical protein
MSGTATTHGAREHARSQAGKKADTQQTIPASATENPPDGVKVSDVVWDETVGSGGYAARILKRGTVMRMTDLRGDGSIGLLCFNADRPIERLNVADTVKVQWNAYLGKGRLLLSDMGRVLMSIDEDTCGQHDTFCGCSTQKSNEARYGRTDGENYRRNARDNFLVAIMKYGLGKKDIPANVNFFKGVKVESDGTPTFNPNSSKPGDFVQLRAEMNVLVVVANCPHRIDPRPDYTVTPVRLTAWRGEPTRPGDALFTSTPEAERAFLNNEDFYLV